MNYANIPENLEKLSTPIIICDEQGIVIYKNTAAVRSVRLPRRHTSILTHLGQTERGELLRLSDRKKPSVLTVQTGDRNARALVMSYLREGKKCSLWVFVSLLQTGSVSGMFAELDNALCAVGREICEYVKTIDEFALALPEPPSASELVRLDKRLQKIIDGITDERRSWLFELGDALTMLKEAIERPLCKYGYSINFPEADASLGKGVRLLIDLQHFFSMYLHLILFSCDSSPNKQVDVSVFQKGEIYCIETLFTLPYPPFYTEQSDCTDLSALSALCPRNSIEIELLKTYSRIHGYEMSYQITHDVENNVRLRLKLPVSVKPRLRSGDESAVERLFVQHDLTLYFWHLIKERYMKYDD